MFFLIASFNLKLWEHRVTKAERDSTVSCHRRQEKALIYSPAVFPPFRYLHCTRHRPREVFVSLIFSLSEGHPRIRSCYWSASKPICCQKHLACSLSVFLGEEKHEGALISFRCPCEAEGEVENENKLDVKRERERAKADCQREPPSGRQHKLVRGKFNNRGQEAEAVSPLCLFDLLLTWVYLAETAALLSDVSFSNGQLRLPVVQLGIIKLSRVELNVTKPWLIHQYDWCLLYVGLAAGSREKPFQLSWTEEL